MLIDPAGPGKAQETGVKRTQEGKAVPADRAPGAPEGSTHGGSGDLVEISDSARELLGMRRAAPAGIQVTEPELERRILDRIADGFYERVDIRAEVVRRLALDLETEGPSTIP